MKINNLILLEDRSIISGIYVSFAVFGMSQVPLYISIHNSGSRLRKNIVAGGQPKSYKEKSTFFCDRFKTFLEHTQVCSYSYY